METYTLISLLFIFVPIISLIIYRKNKYKNIIEDEMIHVKEDFQEIIENEQLDSTDLNNFNEIEENNSLKENFLSILEELFLDYCAEIVKKYPDGLEYLHVIAGLPEFKKSIPLHYILLIKKYNMDISIDNEIEKLVKKYFF